MKFAFSPIPNRQLTFTCIATFLFLFGLNSQPTFAFNASEQAQIKLETGWAKFVEDNDIDAFKDFNDAYHFAKMAEDTDRLGISLLYMGICTYSVSFTEGLEYSFKAMEEFKKFETSNPEKAKVGRSKCLQLISTIKSRQGKYGESIELSSEAALGFENSSDTAGYLGLIYNSLGIAYGKLGVKDSSAFFHRKALEDRLTKNNRTYLPGSYTAMAKIELENGNQTLSHEYLTRAIEIADSTKNRQALVLGYLGLSEWLSKFSNRKSDVESTILKAKEIAKGLTDRSFYLKTLEALIAEKKVQGQFQSALQLGEEVSIVKDSLYSWEKQKIQRSLEVQFDVSEKDRLLKLAQKEKEVTALTNYLLWAVICFVILIATGIIVFLRRNNEKNKLLLQTKEALVKVIEEQKILREQQMQNELEFKESQLTAMTAQMLQKHELMQELKSKMDEDKNISSDSPLNKLINKGQNQDKDWTDFNKYFEGLNKNFYSRLKQSYPDISPNDLKICALIKLNLSIKEMASILNISPDSVKTARYRLRKKLQLNTEDNLTDFILNLK